MEAAPQAERIVERPLVDYNVEVPSICLLMILVGPGSPEDLSQLCGKHPFLLFRQHTTEFDLPAMRADQQAMASLSRRLHILQLRPVWPKLVTLCQRAMAGLDRQLP